MMLSLFPSSLKIIFRNWRSLLWFGLLYRSLGFFFFFPLLQLSLEEMLAAAGAEYLSQENLSTVIAHPAAFLIGVFLSALFAGYVYFEIAALVLCCEAGWQGRQIKTTALLKAAAVKTLGLFRFRTFPVFLLLLPVLALSAVPLTSGALQSFRAPEFILEYIQSNLLLSLLCLLLWALLHLLLFFYLFGIPEILLRDQDLIRSWRTSRALLRGRQLRVAAGLLGFLLLLLTAVLLFAAASVLFLYACSRLFYPGNAAAAAFQIYYVSWSRIALTVAGGFLSAGLTAAILLIYHRLRGETAPAREKTRQTRQSRLKGAAAVFLTLLFLALFSESEISGNLFYPREFAAEIVAHRAGAAFAPENTLAALEQAVEDGADMAEIDVRQTRDGVLIVLHDANFRRTTGVKRAVWEADYDQIKSLDAGAYFAAGYAGEPIPTLKQMLLAAKGRIRLMIELKSTGRERNLEGGTVDLIRGCGMEKQCMIASMDLEILKRVKELAPEIQTVYISSLLYSKFYHVEYIDSFSVETTYLTPRMAAQIHTQNKKLYAWTANTAGTIRKILYCQADGLVTDNPALARYYLEQGGSNLLLDALTDFLFPGEVK